MAELFKNFDYKHYQTQFSECTTEVKARIHFAKLNRYPVKIVRQSSHKLNIKDALPLTAKSPASVDLRSKFPPCYDQGQLGSCTANAMVGAYQYLKPSFMGSRLFLYYNERVIENDVKYDNGAYIHDGIQSLEKTGLCPETDWPYIISKFATKPSTKCYTDAVLHKVVKAYSVTQTVAAMKALLVSGTPFIVGITVYSSFESYAVSINGLVPYPTSNDSSIGGHCIVCIGFSDTVQCPGAPPGSWLMRNSWGTGWGLNGYFWLPYQYLTDVNLSSDNWYLQSISG